MYRLIVRRPKLEVPPSAGKNTRIVLVLCHTWKCIPTAISGGVDISEVPECHLLQQMSSQWESEKLLQGLVSHELTAYVSVFNLFLTQWIMAILWKGWQADNSEPHNSPKLNFTNIWDLCSNFVKCESFLESNCPDILALCETKLDDSIDSDNFSVRGYLPLIWKDSISHISFCMGPTSRKLCRFFLMFLPSFASLSVLLPFSIDPLLHSYAPFLILFCLT